MHERIVAEQLLDGIAGWTLGDRNYRDPQLTERLAQQGLILLAPLKSAKHEPEPWPNWLKHKRYRIKTVFGQSVERFRAKRVWARYTGHLISRWPRIVLAYTFAGMLCLQAGLPPLRFSKLITD